MRNDLSSGITKELERVSVLSRFQSRCTIRLVLEEMGLRSDEVNADEMGVVLRGMVFHQALMLRGLSREAATQVAAQVAGSLTTSRTGTRRHEGTRVETLRKSAAS